MTAALIRRLTLSNFRSYHAAGVGVDARLVVLVGPNGAGKTNLIEAISLLAPGRGLRRATLDELAFAEGDGGWAVSAEVEGAYGLVTLGTGIDPPADGDTTTRKFRIDREPATSASAFAEHLRIVWLTPSMDQLFMGPASERRRFLDRLVLTVHPEHGSRINALERALRSRNRLLEEPHPDLHWLGAVEHETAELAVAVAAARAEAVQRLSAAIAARGDDGFPLAALALDGWIEALALDHPASDIEDRYRAVLHDNRGRDAAAGRTLDGVHLTDLEVLFEPKGIAARDASTGEQKALLIGIVLAHARLVTDMAGCAPIILLDEVVAHLDPGRRAALFDALDGLGTQVWMTGADPAAFADLGARADMLDIAPGQVRRRGTGA